MKIKSTLKFPTTTPTGIIAPTQLTEVPAIIEGNLKNEPPVEEATLWLVNGMVFNVASNRSDFIMFDPAQTVRDAEGKAISQGGYIMRDGSTHSF